MGVAQKGVWLWLLRSGLWVWTGTTTGDFSGVAEDVTGDTLGLTLEHFRDLASGHVEAARLELELKNDDHKYSPPNPRSPLSGLLKPGRKVLLRAAYPYDALADAPGVRLSGHAPDLDPSFSWTEHARGSG